MGACRRCIFCRLDSTSSKSVEHIIPESLGNRTHVLAPGVVCDNCNNYLGREVEAPFLNSSSVRALRFEQEIANKRGRIPTLPALLLPGFPIELDNNPRSFTTSPEALRQIERAGGGTIAMPRGAAAPSAGAITSRFVAKVALGALAHRFVEFEQSLDDLIDDAQLDPLREHARKGYLSIWPVHSRRIYPINAKWLDAGNAELQVLHEFTFLLTELQELYFVLALFGTEFAINVAGPTIDGYSAWLNLHCEVSPLYRGDLGMDLKLADGSDLNISQVARIKPMAR